MYETDNGTLVVTSEPVRTANVEELLERATVASANMYKKFADMQNATQKQSAVVTGAAELKTRPKKEKPAPKPKPEHRKPMTMLFSIGGGAFFANDFGGGIIWGNNEQLAMPYSGGGAYLFFDAKYGELVVGYSGGGGKWESPAATESALLPDMLRSYVNISILAKYPVGVGSVIMFPLLGIDHEISTSGKLKYDNGREIPLDYGLGAVLPWLKFGVGADIYLGSTAYLRAETLYGIRAMNEYEQEMWDPSYDGWYRLGNGLTVRIGLGVKI